MFPARRHQLGVRILWRSSASTYGHHHRRLDAQPQHVGLGRWTVLVGRQDRQCHWHHHRPCDRHLLHCSRLLQQHVRQPDLHGAGDNQLRQKVGSSFRTWRFGLSNRRRPWPYRRHAVLVRQSPPIWPMPRRSGGSSSVSGLTGSPAHTSTSSPRPLDIDIEDRFFLRKCSQPVSRCSQTSSGIAIRLWRNGYTALAHAHSRPHFIIPLVIFVQFPMWTFTTSASIITASLHLKWRSRSPGTMNKDHVTHNRHSFSNQGFWTSRHRCTCGYLPVDLFSLVGVHALQMPSSLSGIPDQPSSPISSRSFFAIIENTSSTIRKLNIDPPRRPTYVPSYHELAHAPVLEHHPVLWRHPKFWCPDRRRHAPSRLPRFHPLRHQCRMWGYLGPEAWSPKDVWHAAAHRRDPPSRADKQSRCCANGRFFSSSTRQAADSPAETKRY